MKLATLCYVQTDHQTLMMHRIKKEGDVHIGKWNGLGGKFLPGESPEDCVKREVLEESGLTISNPKIAGLLTWPMFDRKDDWYAFVFKATDFTGELLSDCPEGELSWVDTNKILSLELWEGDYVFLPWVLEGRFFSAKFIYESGKLISHDVSFYELS